jgi:hypothetical protein
MLISKPFALKNYAVLATALFAVILLPSFFNLNPASGYDCPDVILNADFNADAVDQLPDTTLPGPPDGDSLVLDESYGTILVRNAIGTLINKPVELSHTASPVGNVNFAAYPQQHQPCDSLLVSWRSLERNAEYKYCRCVIRGNSNYIIATLEYRGYGKLTYNHPDSVIPVGCVPDVDQLFEIKVNFDAKTTSLSIDGIPITGFQDVPFYHNEANELYYVQFISQWEDLVVDDISICSYCEPVYADLVIAAFELEGPQEVYLGEDISERLTLRIANIGDIPSPQCMGALYLSEDTSVSSDDSLLTGGTFIIGDIPATDSMTITFPDSVLLPKMYNTEQCNIIVVADEEDVVFEVAEDNNSYHCEVTVIICFERTLTIIDYQGEPMAWQIVGFYSVANDPPNMTETPIGTGVTNSEGEIFTDLELCTDDSVKVRVYSGPVMSGPHPDVNPSWFFERNIDNAQFDYSTGAIYYDVVSPNSAQTFQLNHTEIIYHLLVTVDWDATSIYLYNLGENFRLLSNYLYDVFDGQVRLGTVHIVDDNAYANKCDMLICAQNTIWPISIVFAWKNCGGRNWFGVLMPGKWFGSRESTINGFFDEYPFDMLADNDYRMKGHELGHYLHGFGNEYENEYGTALNHAHNYGYMDKHYSAGGARSSELSRLDIEYPTAGDRDTDHWDMRNKSCADYFKYRFEDYYNDIYHHITRPEDYLPGKVLHGPNSDLNNLNYDVGQLVDIDISDNATGALPPTPFTTIWPEGASSWYNVCTRQGLRIICQGSTKQDGWIRLRGYHYGDVVFGSNIDIRKLTPAGFSKDGKGYRSSDFYYSFFSGQPDDSGDFLFAVFEPISGTLPFIYLLSPHGDSIRCDLVVQNHPPAPPEMELTTMAGDYSVTKPMIPDGDQYYCIFADDTLFNEGMLISYVIDSAEMPYEIYNQCSYYSLVNAYPHVDIGSPSGMCMLKIDSLNTIDRGIYAVSSTYPPILTGLNDNAIWAGEVFSWSFLDDAPMVGINILKMHYVEAFFGDSAFGDSITTMDIAENLTIFKWDEGLREWDLIGGSVDTSRHSITALITEPGAYTAFLLFPPGGICGDANGDDQVNIGDAVFLISYIFKGGPPPDPVCIGDTNGDGDTNVGDAVYLIAYVFKGGPPPVEDCCP